MTKHKWHKEIKAWADGADIEFKTQMMGWLPAVDPQWHTEHFEYRMKPQPKDEALRMAIDALKNINGWRGLRDYEARALDACKEALERPQPKEPQYAHAWLNKEDGSISLEYECEVYGVMEDDFYKYLGRIELEVDDD